MLELYREAGIDLELYRDEPGLEIDRGTTEARDRGGHGNDGAGAPLATQTMYRDFAFLDQPAIDAFAQAGPAGRVPVQLLGRGLGRHALVPPGRRRPERCPRWPSWTADRPKASSA